MDLKLFLKTTQEIWSHISQNEMASVLNKWPISAKLFWKKIPRSLLKLDLWNALLSNVLKRSLQEMVDYEETHSKHSQHNIHALFVIKLYS